MNLQQEKALFHLTGKVGLSQVTPERLQQLADESPYFAPARFFLTAKLKEQGQANIWVPQAQKTNLYFSDPGWLQFQLDSIPLVPETIHEPEEKAVTVVAPAPAIAPVEKTEKAIGITVPTIEAVREMMRKIDNSQETTGETEELPLDEEDLKNEAIIETEPAENKIAGMLSSQLADFKKPVEADAVLDIDNDKKRFYTVDYFASQGIKVDLSALADDKLTTHLRKFTDWLKQIKNVNGNPNDLGTSPELEKAVAETAKNSNETREIVTEAMADVLEKQGQIDRAIQLYIKLSFINPEKSSYFAAKIEQLKGI